MKRVARFAIVAVLAVCLLPTSSMATAGDAEQIRGAFESYRSALLAGQGHEAALSLSRSTHAYYDHVRQLALVAKAEDLQRQPLADQLQVLLYRSRVPRRMLESMSPVGLISHSIEQGWIARDSVSKIEPGKIDVRGNEAMVHVVTQGKGRGPAFLYRREAEGWRLDLVPVMRATEKPLRNAAQRENMEVSDFLLAVVERAVEREIGVEAWIPLVERDAAPDAPTEGQN
ncbi:MAG: hypothetical protein QF570_19650 [Myxococcota bacterium]|nr:hypothetical protein [Myxococcota bacterium]